MDRLDKKKLVAANHQRKLLEEISKSKNVIKMSKQQIVVEIREVPPIFMTKFLVNDAPVIIISAKKEENLVVPVLKEQEENPAEISLLLETTGTPLPAPFTEEEQIMLQHRVGDLQIDDLPESEKFKPIPNAQAREVLRLYAEGIDELCRTRDLLPAEMSPVYILCDSSDGLKMALLQTSANDTRAFTHSFAKQEEKCDEDRVKILLEAAMKSARKMVAPTKSQIKVFKMECINVLQWYKLGRCVTLDNGTRVTDGVGFTIKVLWTDRNTNFTCLDALPPAVAPVVLDAHLDYGYKKWEGGSLQSDLMILKELHECMLNKSVHINHPLHSARDLVDVTSFDFGPEILHKAKTQPFVNSEQEKGCNDFMQAMQQVKDETRRNMDVTDYIWNALKYGSTLGAIGTCLETIFTASMDETPFILPSNKTKMAKILNSMPMIKSAPTTGFLPSLTAELLLECGYLKLVRDIVFLCEVSGGKSKEGAQKACGFELSDWGDKLVKLEHAQRCVEFVLQANVVLCFKPQVIPVLLNNVLDKEGSHVKINIKAEDVYNFLQTMQPSLRVWQFKCTNSRLKGEMRQVDKPSGEERKQGQQKGKYQYKLVQTHEVVSQASAKCIVSKTPILPWAPCILQDKSVCNAVPPTSVDVQKKTLAPIYGTVYCTTLNQIYNI